jgi:hypothetical protein
MSQTARTQLERGAIAALSQLYQSVIEARMQRERSANLVRKQNIARTKRKRSVVEALWKRERGVNTSQTQRYRSAIAAL